MLTEYAVTVCFSVRVASDRKHIFLVKVQWVSIHKTMQAIIGHKNNPRDGILPPEGQTERTGAVQPGQEKTPGRPESRLSVAKGGYKKGTARSVPRGWSCPTCWRCPLLFPPPFLLLRVALGTWDSPTPPPNPDIGDEGGAALPPTNIEHMCLLDVLSPTAFPENNKSFGI